MVVRLFSRLPRLPSSRLKRFVRLLFVWRAYIREVAKSARRYPFPDVIFGLRHGFAADRVFLYGRQCASRLELA